MPPRSTVTIGGAEYGSLRAASRATGTPLSTLRRGLGLIGPEQPANLPAFKAKRKQQAAVRRAVKSGKASPLRGHLQRVCTGRTERFEMPREGKRRVSFTIEALAEVDRRIQASGPGGFAQATLLFRHYYLSPTQKDKHGQPLVRVRQTNIVVGIDLLTAMSLTDRELLGLYPFDSPDRRLHEDRPRDALGRPHKTHKDDGGLLAVTLTPRLHTSL